MKTGPVVLALYLVVVGTLSDALGNEKQAKTELPQKRRFKLVHFEPAVVEFKDGKKRDYSITRLSRKFKTEPGVFAVPGPTIILKEMLNGQRILNPVGENYSGTTSGLKNMTFAEAQTLFGEPRTSVDGVRIFDLQYANGSNCFVTVETRWEDGKLTSYRVNGRGLNDQKWTSF